MPLLSGNQYKIFVYLIYGYQMAIETYHQPYYEISQNEIVKKTGIPRPTAQRAITELKEKGLVSYSTKQQGQTKTRARYVIPDYETYLVHFDAKNDKSYAQNDTYIKDNNDIDKQSSVLQSRPDLKRLYDTSNALGDALDSQTTIDGLNGIKDKFIKLWDEAESLYVYDTKYQADKDKNWGAFLKRYNGRKSKINRQTAKQHTPKQVDKKDNREISEMGNVGGGAFTPLFDVNIYNPWLLEENFMPQYFYQYINGAYSKMKSHKSKWDKQQLEHTIKSAQEWIGKTWNRSKDEEVNTNEKEDDGSYIALNFEEWNLYIRKYLESAYKDAIGECEPNTQSS